MLSRRIERLLPAHLTGDDRRRAAISGVMSTFAAVCAVALLLVMLVTSGVSGVHPVVWVAPIFSFCPLVLLLRGRSIDLAAHMGVVGPGFATVLAFCLPYGGVANPAAMILIAIPSAVLLTLSRRWALFWTAMVFLTLTVLVITPGWLDQGPNPHFTYIAGATLSSRFIIGLLIGMMTACLMLVVGHSERLRTVREGELSGANDELEAARVEAAAANNAKSAFLANMSHEMRTPLNGVVGLSELLIDDMAQLSDEHQMMVTTIRDAGLETVALINEILDLSRIESGAVDLEVAPFSMASVCASVVQIVQHECDAKRVGLVCEVADNVPAQVAGDPLRVKQVLTNLVSNAVKFTHMGDIKISVSALGDTIRCEVSDTGIGIPESARATLFEKFSQVDASTTRRYGGTGLGLAIVHQLIEIMEGRIGYQSVVGQGTTFWFELPLPGVMDRHPPTTRRRRASAKKGWRVLVVEDNPLNQKVLGAQLQRAAVEFDTVRDGSQVLPALRQQAYDIILMDMTMPTVDGFEATRRVRASRDFAHLPIVAVTARAFNSDRRRAFASGVDDYLTKPATQEDVERTLARWLDNVPERVVRRRTTSRSAVGAPLRVVSEGASSDVAR